MQGSETALVPHRSATYLGVVAQEDGFCHGQRARAPTPKGLAIGELPVVSLQGNQRARRAGWFAALVSDDDQQSETNQADNIDIEDEGPTEHRKPAPIAPRKRSSKAEDRRFEVAIR